jgi:outer membrane protein OmpA-like peptidoglycan-associated protein
MKQSTVTNTWALSMTLVLLYGCSGMQKNQALVEAEEIYKQAKAEEEILKNAPQQLERAEQALELAASANSDEEMTSLAYVAKTRTRTAMAISEREEAKARLTELSKIKDVERLKARELEISREQAAKEEAIAKAESLQKELKELQAVKTERGMVMTLGDVLFATGKAELQPGAMSTIERLAEFLEEYPNKSVLIEGHTDSVGSEAFNQGLSERRAMAVKTALIQADVDPARINTVGYGETRPIADNDTSAGRLKNRRVEIVIRD